jgi:hypothetical protein
MHRAGFAGCLTLAAVSLLAAEAVPAGPGFQELRDLVRAHLPGVTAEEVDRAAVQGILSNLADQVAFVPGQRLEPPQALTRTNIFEESIAYLRVGTVGDTLPPAVTGAWAQLTATNRLKGIVIDLRYAGGDDYLAAARTASLFVSKQQELLDFGKGMVQSEPGAGTVAVPVAVLVNSGTSSAAEALAAVFRATGAGLILGAKTAGRAMMYQEYPVKTGGALRISRGPIHLGDGTKLETGRVTPDIPVNVEAAEERAYFADAFRVSTTNAAGSVAASAGRRVRFSEADLARERRDAGSGDTPAMRARRPEPDKPAVSDPVLARALDLLKGLAVVRRAQP